MIQSNCSKVLDMERGNLSEWWKNRIVMMASLGIISKISLCNEPGDRPGNPSYYIEYIIEYGPARVGVIECGAAGGYQECVDLVQRVSSSFKAWRGNIKNAAKYELQTNE
jgi:hypothetical protein